MPKQIGKIYKMVVNGEIVLPFDITRNYNIICPPCFAGSASFHLLWGRV
jgi:hypothetical protein